MNHRFERQEIQAGKAFTLETCPCGAISRRYQAGRYYQLPDGAFGQHAPPCTRELKAVVAPVPRQIKAKDLKAFLTVQSPAVTEQIKPREVVQVAVKPETYLSRPGLLLSRGGPYSDAEKEVLGIAKKLTEPEATLKDALIIINVLYEDLAAAGIRSNGRQMAGRFLYSNGYTQTVKNLQA